MRERPILFSGPMVRAILSDRKTQTRRVLKQATGPSLSVSIEDEPGVAELSWLHGDGPGYEVHETIKRVSCPYGQPGDRLWVREAWGVAPGYDRTPPRDLKPHGMKVNYAADAALHGCKTRPSIHMPRWASRITLEIVGVRVERLQDISDEDALAEGADRTNTSIPGYAKERFRALWETINGGDSWTANPFVWVVEFRRLA